MVVSAASSTGTRAAGEYRRMRSCEPGAKSGMRISLNAMPASRKASHARIDHDE